MTTTYEVGQRVEVLSDIGGSKWVPAVVTEDASGPARVGWLVRFDDDEERAAAGRERSVIRHPEEMRRPAPERSLAERCADADAIDDACRQIPSPPSNALCRCGAPSLRLFTSHECSRGPECPIVAGEPEPDEVRHVDLNNAYYADQIEVGYCAVGRGHEARHPLREGAIAAWRAKVAAKPKVAIGVDLATGPDRAAMVVGRVVDATPDADGRVTIQWRAPVMTPAEVGAMQRDAMWGVRR